MAGQKNDASTSILRRVIDRTPLRPAHLESLRPQALTPAQFAARYFNRESRVIQRLLGIGGDFSPIHRTIGRSVVSRFTDFNRSFGPIQRALRPQPEHRPRKRHHVEDGQEYYDGYDGDDFSYSPEPEPPFFEQPTSPLSQYSQIDYASPTLAALPWETPLDAMPLPVARRTEFQPANLRYLNNPERLVGPVVERSNISPVERPTPVISSQTFQAAQSVERSFTPVGEEPAAFTATPLTPPALQVAQPAPDSGQPGNSLAPATQGNNKPDQNRGQYSGQPDNSVVPATPGTVLSPAELDATGGVSEYSETAFGPVPSPQPPTQPALSRALQRTFEAIAPQPGLAEAAFNQASNLGASPAAVARHFAVPATLARYRAVKQAADKVFLGEQSAWESEPTPVYEAQPAFQPLNTLPGRTMPGNTVAYEAQPASPVLNTPVQRAVVETALAQEATTKQVTTQQVAGALQEASGQQAVAELQEARRVREETRALLQAQESAAQPVQPSQEKTSQGQPSQEKTSQGQPLPGRQTNFTGEEPARIGEASHDIQAETAQAGPVQRAVEAVSTTEPGQVLAPVPAIRATWPVAASQGVSYPGEAGYRVRLSDAPQRVAASQGVSYPGEAVVRQSMQPEPAQISGVFGLNRSEIAPDLFDAAIPTSLLENAPFAGETGTEVQRLTANRLTGPVTTGGWANTLAALRNNPGVEARTVVARQLSAPENGSTRPTDAWTSAGAGVYYDRRRVRRTVAGAEAEAAGVAAETQNRIFSLAETTSGPGSFQPQLLKGLMAEAIVPAQPVVNRRQLANSQSELSLNQPLAANREINSPSSPTVSSEINSPSSPAVNRVFEAGENEAAFPSGGLLPGQAQGQPIFDTQSIPAENRANIPGEAVLPEEAGATPQPALDSAESPARLSTNPVQFEAAYQPEIYGQTSQETALPGRGLWTVQSSGLQSAGAADSPFDVSRSQRTVQSSGLRPTALQRVFKRLDLAETADVAFAENSGFDFANLPLSYAVRPGSRPNRTGQPGFEDADSYNAAYPVNDFAGEPARPTGFESGARLAEPSVTRAYAGPDPAIPAREIVGEATTRPLSPEMAKEAAQLAGETGFADQPVSPGRNTPGVQGTPSPVSGGTGRLSQPRYFINSLNSLEAAWLSPENRLLVERLPGGSGALQRLMQAPGQYQAMLEQHRAGSALRLNLASLGNNPGLSPSVARALEDAAINTESVDGWMNGRALNFVQRRRTVRQAQAGFGEAAGDAGPGEFSSFEPSLGQTTGLSFATQGQPGLAQTEVSRLTGQPTLPGSIQRAASGQQDNFQHSANRETTARIQGNANRETAARIQGNTTEPGQPGAAAPNFTISGDWVAQLQRRFEGSLVGRLSDSTSQIMRFLNNEGASFTGFGTGQNFEQTPDFNYTVPPLLWRKVSDYAPQGGLPANPSIANPSIFEGGQPGFAYTSPGEVLRAYEQGETYPGLPDDAAYPAQSGETPTTRPDGSARLDLPRLEQTHRLLQRIFNLEKVNTSLELAHRMDNHIGPAVQATSDRQNRAQPGTMPLSMPFAPGIQRQPETSGRFDNGVDNRIGSFVGNGVDNRVDAVDAAEAVTGPTPPAPLRMSDVPVNRTAGTGRFLEVDPELFADEDFARPTPAPEIRTIEVRVPDRQTYGTPLEVAAARNGSNGPNIGQGEILQPLAIQRKASANGSGQAATYAPLAQPTLHNIIKTSVGRSLDHPVQRKMTNIFGAHFQDVQVHTGDEAAQATRHVGAEAFTLGSNIYFAPGRYQPDNQAGQALIGHELTHVIQQSSLPSLGGGRIPETSSLGQSLEHHAIANEQLLLRHLSNTHDDHDHGYHGFSSDDSGRLSFQDNHSSSYSRGAATVERSYQPVAEQNSHPPINPSHIRTDSGSGSMVQREVTIDDFSAPSSGGAVDVNEIISNQENMDKLARKVYQIIRDELIIERERGFGPGNGKFF